MQKTQSTQYTPLCKEASISGTIKLLGPVSVGQDIGVIIILKNEADTPKNTELSITAHSILYTRKPIHEILRKNKCIAFGPNEEKEIPLNIDYESYQKCLTSDNMIEVRAVCIGKEKKDAVILQRDIVLDNPKLDFKVSEEAMVGKPMTVEVSFLNPLSKEVTHCILRAEGSGLIKEEITVELGDVKPQETLTIPIEITPYRPGVRQLLVDFTCCRFTNIKGFWNINVAANEEAQNEVAPKIPASKK